jgi:serine/threonine protein kinase
MNETLPAARRFTSGVLAIASSRGGTSSSSGEGPRTRDDGVLRPGARLRSYQLTSRLAIGATSEVWLAKLTGAQGFEKIVVLKVIAADPGRRAELADMLTNEATIGARLYHPGIVHLLDFAQADSRCFISMEHLDGVTLQQAAGRLSELGQRFPLALVVYLASQVCRGLHYAHELSDSKGSLGFLHRGINPDNVMLLRSGAVKLIDFGSSRMRSVPEPPAALGTQTHYAPPERLNGQPEDRRGDVYSLGVVLYQLLSGRRPFEGDDEAVRARIIEGRPTPLRELVPSVPESVAQVVGKAMARAPEERFPTAEALATTLQNAYEAHLASDWEAGRDELDLRIGLTQIFGTGANGGSELPGAMPLRMIARAASPTLPISSEIAALTIPSAPLIPPAAPPAPASGSGWVEDDSTEPCSMPVATDDAARAVLATSKTPPAAELGAVPVTATSPARDISRLFETTSGGRRLGQAYWQRDDASPEVTGSVFDLGIRRESSIHFMGRDFSGFGEVTGSIDLKSPDIFAVRRRREEPPAPSRPLAWVGPEPAKPLAPPPAPAEDRRTPRQIEAARCFDRGLAFLNDKQYGLALDEWERALELDPNNRTYQTNLKRLRARR